MKHVLALLLAICFTLPVQAQSDLAWAYTMKPKMGHYDATLQALREHTQWRRDHDDPWVWDIYEIINGPDLGTFIARSGGHTWADFDAYRLEGANEHFRSTVTPHLESFTSVITSGDTTNVRLPEWIGEAPLYLVVNYDIANGKMESFQKGLSSYHKAIADTAHETYYYFQYFANGGTGYEVQGVFPARSFSDLAEDDPSLESVLKEYFSEMGLEAIQDLFEDAISDARAYMVMRHTDMSTAR